MDIGNTNVSWRKHIMQDREQSKMARGLGVEYDTDNKSIDELGF